MDSIWSPFAKTVTVLICGRLSFKTIQTICECIYVNRICKTINQMWNIEPLTESEINVNFHCCREKGTRKGAQKWTIKPKSYWFITPQDRYRSPLHLFNSWPLSSQFWVNHLRWPLNCRFIFLFSRPSEHGRNPSQDVSKTFSSSPTADIGQFFFVRTRKQRKWWLTLTFDPVICDSALCNQYILNILNCERRVPPTATIINN